MTSAVPFYMDHKPSKAESSVVAGLKISFVVRTKIVSSVGLDFFRRCV